MYLIFNRSKHDADRVFFMSMTHDQETAYKLSKDNDSEVYKINNMERIIKFNLSFEEITEKVDE